MNYENMTFIEIQKFNTITHKEGTREAFLQPVDWCYYDEALSTLSSNAFKLWFYLLRWNGKGKYDFSPAKLCKALKIGSKNTVYTARDELVDKKYMVKVSDVKYIFYPCGHADLIYQKLTN